MAGEVGDLRQQLTSLQESQANFVANLAERARGNIDMMEKTVAMTGLDVNKLLQTVSERLGRGRSLHPGAGAPSGDEGEQKLLASVATLGDQVDRWEKLQFILRSLPLTAPIDSYYISSAYGARMDPFNGERAVHEGIDMVEQVAVRSPGDRAGHREVSPAGKAVTGGWSRSTTGSASSPATPTFMPLTSR